MVQWGELFFDLFYVAGAYNLASILKEGISGLAVLYFVGCFGGIMLIWNHRLLFDAGFAVTNDDALGVTVVSWSHLIILATAVLHIRPVGLMAYPTESVEMFCYALALLLESILVAVVYIIVYLYVEGGPEARVTARRELIKNSVVMAFYGAATVVAGVEFYVNGAGSVQANLDEAVDVYQHEATAAAAPDSSGRPNYVPIVLVICGWISYGAALFWEAFIRFPRLDDVRKVTIPYDGEYIIHRHGEWIMLMLGESVLSLLIVQISYGKEYYVTFYCGILSVMGFQSLHYHSQPHHAEEHAMRRSTKAGTLFFLLMGIYSMALVAIGASYKLLLTEHIYDDGYSEDFMYGLSRQRRSLGGDDMSPEERRKRIAVLFTASLTVAFVVLDLMILCHKGIKENWYRIMSGKGVTVTLVRMGLDAFTATLSLYVTEPQTVSVAGLVVIMLQVAVRVAGSIIFPMEKIERKDGGSSTSDGQGRGSEHSAFSNIMYSIFYSPLPFILPVEHQDDAGSLSDVEENVKSKGDNV